MKKGLYIAGLLLIALGFMMAILGVSLFTYRGNSLNPIVSDIGKFSFLHFIEVILLGALLSILSAFFKKPDSKS